MTPEAIRAAIAEVLKWRSDTRNVGPRGSKMDGWWTPFGRFTTDINDIPDYPGDLNAMHEAEKVLNAGQINTYIGHLFSFAKVAEAGSNPWEIIASRVAIHATASQRAEAFLRTLNLWTE